MLLEQLALVQDIVVELFETEVFEILVGFCGTVQPSIEIPGSLIEGVHPFAVCITETFNIKSTTATASSPSKYPKSNCIGCS